MPLVDMKDLLRHASREGYAVCAFDLASLDFLAAVTAAAEDCRAPVVLSVTEAHLEYVDAELLAAAIDAAARRARVPVAIQFHRAGSSESVLRAIRLGSNSVTTNSPHRLFEKNIAAVRAAAEVAHSVGVPVEAGLNAILRFPTATVSSDTVAAEAVHDFVERTGVDFLTIDATREPATARPRLDFKRLALLRRECEIPFTMDGHQRFSEMEHRQLIEGGVVKFTHYASLSRSAAERIRQNVKTTHRNGYLALIKGAREAIRTQAERCLRLSGSAGRANNAASNCRLWIAVEHRLHNNVTTQTGPARTVP